MMEQAARTKQRHYVHKKLKWKLYIYLGIFFAIFIISVYNIAIGYINALLGAAAWAFGIGIGYIAGRSKKLLWNEETELIITKSDAKGILILMCYMAFSLSRRWMLEHWVHGTILTALIFCMVAGSRFGKIVSIRGKIKRILREQGII